MSNINYINCIFCNNKVKLQNSKNVFYIKSNVEAFKDKKFPVWRCNYCNSIHSKQDVDLDFYYKNYPVYRFKNDIFINFHYPRRLKRLKKKGLKKKDTILDFGCGSGSMVNFLHHQGYKNTFGYDKYNSKFSDIKILEQSYDFIICQDVFEHLENPVIALKKIVKMLKKGGVLSIGTTNADYIKLNDLEKCIMQLHQPYHRHILSEKSLILLAKKAGLKVKRIYHRYYADNWLPFANQKFRAEYSFLWGNILDTIFDKKLEFKKILSPRLFFYGIFGYFFPPRTEMEILFQLSN